eukprot:767170-Hanusia_phi.AAC.2
MFNQPKLIAQLTTTSEHILSFGLHRILQHIPSPPSLLPSPSSSLHNLWPLLLLSSSLLFSTLILLVRSYPSSLVMEQDKFHHDRQFITHLIVSFCDFPPLRRPLLSNLLASVLPDLLSCLFLLLSLLRYAARWLLEHLDELYSVICLRISEEQDRGFSSLLTDGDMDVCLRARAPLLLASWTLALLVLFLGAKSSGFGCPERVKRRIMPRTHLFLSSPLSQLTRILAGPHLLLGYRSLLLLATPRGVCAPRAGGHSRRTCPQCLHICPAIEREEEDDEEERKSRRAGEAAAGGGGGGGGGGGTAAASAASGGWGGRG